LFDPETEAKIEQLTTLIVQDVPTQSTDFLREQVRALAEAEIMSSHIRAKRISHLEGLVGNCQSISGTARLKDPEQLRRTLPLLLSMKRYDERASSRWRRAMRNLCDIGHGGVSHDDLESQE
jgi:hypothetical protein